MCIMLQLATIVFFGLFAIVEIYQSVKDVQLPMPIYLVLGIALAVVSNLAKIDQSTANSNKAAQPVAAPPSSLQNEDQVVSSI
jgi:hypothetical protein